jgi:hypothetical protein
VQTSVGYLAGFVPFVVGRRAKLPAGTTVVLEIDDLARVTVGDAEVPPAATLFLTATTFGALAAGRSDAPRDDVRIDGDATVAGRVLDVLGFLP